MKKVGKIFLLLLFCLSFPLFLGSNFAEAIELRDCEEKLGKGELGLGEAQQCEKLLDQLYKEANAKKRSLQSEVAKFDAAIGLTTTKIYSTGKEIETLVKEVESLSGKIIKLDLSLDKISAILVKRIVQTYKTGNPDAFLVLFSSQDLGELFSRLRYLRSAQLHDRELMIELESVRTDFEDRKTLKEEKQTELEEAKRKLESQKALLATQKADKERLFRETKNSEVHYQNLLATSRAEIEAIQGIIAGRGEETEVGEVGEGERIAGIIPGASACSSGTHLHFEIREGNSVKNPFQFLRNVGLDDDSGGDPFQGTGDWNWPLNEPIKFNQGFGSNTSAIRSGVVWYSFHTGIDISSSDLIVKAVKKGKLYRGAIGCGGGTLRYVRVDHADSNIDTYYLHVNY